MKISIRNFRRLERADIEGGRIVLVGGNNDNGKSSVLMATAAALTGLLLPPNRAKKDAGKLVRRGAAKASVSVTLGDSSVLATYPALEKVYEGTVKMSTIAAGLHMLSEMKPEEMSLALGRFIGSEPTLEDLIEVCRDEQLPVELSGRIWGAVTKSGWAAVEKQAQETGVKLKGMWEQYTGQKRWGIKVGADWRPEGWDDSFLAAPVEEATIIELRQQLQKARENAAVDASVLERLSAEAAHANDRRKALHEAQEACEQAERDLAEAESDLAKHPEPPTARPDLPCPHCGGFLQLKQQPGVIEIVKSDPAETGLSRGEIDKIRLTRAGIEGNIQNARTRIANSKGAVIEARILLQRAEDAAEELRQIEGRTGGDDVAAVEAKLSDAENRFLLLKRYEDAAKTHEQIKKNAAVQTIIAPDGLRRTVMVRELDRFNREVLAQLCAEAGWPAVKISPDMEISWGDFDWIDLGDSAKWIVNRIIQTAIARLDGSQLVIMDAADILDFKNRSKLFAMLLKQPFEALIGMTYNKPDQMPNLPAANAGVRFWVNNGIAEPI